VPFARPGAYLHGTKADLVAGEMLVPGRESNFEDGRMMNHVERVFEQVATDLMPSLRLSPPT
jgi:hypothetical protein